MAQKRRSGFGNNVGITTFVGQVDITKDSLIGRRDTQNKNDPEQVAPTVYGNTLERRNPEREGQSIKRFTLKSLNRAKSGNEPLPRESL